MNMSNLYWLPECKDFRTRLNELKTKPEKTWDNFVQIAQHNLNFIQTNNLDAVLLGEYGNYSHIPTIKLALLGSSTVSHLKAGIRIAGMRRGLQFVIYETDYGQYLQELTNKDSGLHDFKPDIILFAFDAHHIARSVLTSLDGNEASLRASITEILSYWNMANEAFSCIVLQQAALPCFIDVLGNNEHRATGSTVQFLESFNTSLRQQADIEGVHIISIDRKSARDGLDNWFDQALWHKSKQEIKPTAAPIYGDLVARVVAAIKGRSLKCLVLDLDNTLWGGIIGDDGLDGILLGQGSALGEAFLDFQVYLKNLSKRGVILAICSKNDEKNALEVFEKHPEMILRKQDIACFMANWNDKANNIKIIANKLNIGIDSIVFIDDNPFERALVRRELPMVSVPELPEDPSHYARCIADAGYFEAITLTTEDLMRANQYQANVARNAIQLDVTDIGSYLKNLEMVLHWKNFDHIGLQRIVQLANKTNQFNLTTRRYTTNDIMAVMADEKAFGIQLRLIDKFGDNGIIAIVIGQMQGADLIIDAWLMSCRVLGRQVENATLNIIISESKRLNASRIIGRYVPTEKNSMVKSHYEKMGFSPAKKMNGEDNIFELDLKNIIPQNLIIKIERNQNANS